MLHKLRYVFSRKDKIKLAGVFILILVGSFIELLGVSVFMPFIQVIMDPSVIETNLFLGIINDIFHLTSLEMFLAVLAAIIVLVYIVKNVYLVFMQKAIINFSYNTRMRLATRLLTTYMNEPYTFHLSKNIAELQRSLQVDANQFMSLVSTSLQIIAEIMVCIVLGIYLFDTSHSMTVVVVGLLIICVGTFAYVSKKIALKLGMKNQYYNSKLIQWINQALGGIKEVKVLHREDYFISEYKENYKKLIKGAKTNEMIATIPKYIIETVSIVGILIAIIVKIFWGRREVTAFIPQLSVFAIAAFRLLPSTGKLNSYFNTIVYSLPSLDLIYHDLKEIESCTGRETEKKKTDEKRKLKKEIKINDIVYSYPNTDTNVINHVSLVIPKGKTIALVGSSGAGKTTLADIILGLLPPQEGDILIDNWSVYENLDIWHNMLGYIPQSIYLSDDSIRNNIAFGIKEADIDDNAVLQALKKAQLLDFVEKLPDGLNTFVGDRGVRLSGGQRQRIGIARALYHNPDILVLDEATSALDNETEQAVMEAIESLQGVKTIIIIAHRLTTIRNADIILEVNDGQVRKKNKKDIFPEG